MSLLVFLLLARPGGGTGGAEASPPRLRARGAAPEPTCWHRHGATPGAGRGVEKTQGEAQMQLHNEHSDAEKLSGDEQRRRGLGDRADSAARGAQAPHPPTAAAAWLARTALAFSARMAKLSSHSYFQNSDSRARRVRAAARGTIGPSGALDAQPRGARAPCKLDIKLRHGRALLPSASNLTLLDQFRRSDYVEI